MVSTAKHTTPSTSLLELVYNHIALPRKLPDRCDDERQVHLVERNLTSRWIEACRLVGERTDAQYSHQWEHTRRLLQSCKEINVGGRIDKFALLRELRCLDKGFSLILHVVEQNAGLLVRRYEE